MYYISAPDFIAFNTVIYSEANALCQKERKIEAKQLIYNNNHKYNNK